MKTLLFIVLLTTSASISAKCKDYPEDIRVFYGRADTVILVKIVSAGVVSGSNDYEARYEVIEKFKGDSETEGLVRYSSEAHSILLTPGKNYLLFLNKPKQYVSICNGSREVDLDLRQIQKLRELRDDDL